MQKVFDKEGLCNIDCATLIDGVFSKKSREVDLNVFNGGKEEFESIITPSFRTGFSQS